MAVSLEKLLEEQNEKFCKQKSPTYWDRGDVDDLIKWFDDIAKMGVDINDGSVTIYPEIAKTLKEDLYKKWKDAVLQSSLERKIKKDWRNDDYVYNSLSLLWGKGVAYGLVEKEGEEGATWFKNVVLSQYKENIDFSLKLTQEFGRAFYLKVKEQYEMKSIEPYNVIISMTQTMNAKNLSENMIFSWIDGILSDTKSESSFQIEVGCIDQLSSLNGFDDWLSKDKNKWLFSLGIEDRPVWWMSFWLNKKPNKYKDDAVGKHGVVGKIDSSLIYSAINNMQKALSESKSKELDGDIALAKVAWGSVQNALDCANEWRSYVERDMLNKNTSNTNAGTRSHTIAL